MTVLVAVPDSAEGPVALAAAYAETRLLGTDLVVLSLALLPFALDDPPTDLAIEVIERSGSDDRDPVDAVLDEITARDIERLVIGVRRRSRVGKAFLGSVSQRLLLESPIPVLAVKLPHDN